MGKFVIVVLGLILGAGLVVWYINRTPNPETSTEPSIVEQILEKPLEKYSIENLSARTFEPSAVELGEMITEDAQFTSYVFYFFVDEKRVSGMINAPNEPGNYPAIVMLRGYAPKEGYTTGVGTKRAGEYFAASGFITIAPDFLGYGESDMPSGDIFEARFQTYTTVLSLLSSLPNVNNALESASVAASIIPEKTGVWSHSNGGHIALTVLAITQRNYPTVLWAPVSKPFPYSILYYTDELEDLGKALRKDLADFEKDYDVDSYNITKYFDRIMAPIQLHQGLDDDAVPVAWSTNLTKQLEHLEKEIEYFTYPNADHNLMPDGWDRAIERAEQFYQKTIASGYNTTP